AGTGESGYAGDGGAAKAAKLGGPKGLALADDGSLYVADTENHAIRRIDPRTAIITTVLGTGARGDGPDGDPLACALARPHGVFAAGSTLYVSDNEAHRIRTNAPARRNHRRICPGHPVPARGWARTRSSARPAPAARARSIAHAARSSIATWR